MSDATPEPSNEPEKKRRGQNKRSITFAEMLERRNFSVPDEAFRLYKSLANPLAQFIQQMRAAKVPETTIEQLINLVNQNVGYYKRKLECLKIIATYAHPKPSKEPAPPEIPTADSAKAPTQNKYADMSPEELIAGLPSTNEHFDSGPTQSGQ